MFTHLLVMVTSPFEEENIEWDEKPPTQKQTNKQSQIKVYRAKTGGDSTPNQMLLKCIQVFEEYLMHILSVKDKKSVIKKNSLKIQIYFMIVAIQQTKTVFSDTLSFIFFFYDYPGIDPDNFLKEA